MWFLVWKPQAASFMSARNAIDRGCRATASTLSSSRTRPAGRTALLNYIVYAASMFAGGVSTVPRSAA